jgi:HlyD family secretion protein
MSCSILACSLATATCARPPQPDAYGNVEAVDVLVGAEASGQLVSFMPKEGDALEADAIVGSISAVELGLQRDQLAAQHEANASRMNEIAQQIDVLGAERQAAAAQRDAARAQQAALEAQHEIAQRTFDRTARLFRQQAATAQQLDDAERNVRVLEQQLNAQRDQIRAQESQIDVHTHQMAAARVERQTASAQSSASVAEVAQVNERIRKSQIRNPLAGTVLATYAKAGEIVGQGQALYKIANLQSLDVRAYVGEPQLAALHIGATARVLVDVGNGARRPLPGTVTWISAEAEFTPTPIQTREERADLVYAIKIRVTNVDGLLKIGMPVDVQWDHPSTPQ